MVIVVEVIIKIKEFFSGKISVILNDFETSEFDTVEYQNAKLILKMRIYISLINSASESNVSLIINEYNENEKYNLIFEDVKVFNVNGEITCEEDITLCEIGIFKKTYYIYFHFANGCEIQIYFKNVIIL